MTLRQRWSQWRERDRIIRRTDLSVAEKVAVLQGNMLEPFIRRVERATDAMLDIAVDISRTTHSIHRFSELWATCEESSPEKGKK